MLLLLNAFYKTKAVIPDNTNWFYAQNPKRTADPSQLPFGCNDQYLKRRKDRMEFKAFHLRQHLAVVKKDPPVPAAFW